MIMDRTYGSPRFMLGFASLFLLSSSVCSQHIKLSFGISCSGVLSFWGTYKLLYFVWSPRLTHVYIYIHIHLYTYTYIIWILIWHVFWHSILFGIQILAFYQWQGRHRVPVSGLLQDPLLKSREPQQVQLILIMCFLKHLKHPVW